MKLCFADYFLGQMSGIKRKDGSSSNNCCNDSFLGITSLALILLVQARSFY